MQGPVSGGMDQDRPGHILRPVQVLLRQVLPGLEGDYAGRDRSRPGPGRPRPIGCVFLLFIDKILTKAATTVAPFLKMEPRMLPMPHHAEIPQPIVKRISVAMMNHLARQQLPAEMPLHQHPMLRDLSPSDMDQLINFIPAPRPPAKRAAFIVRRLPAEHRVPGAHLGKRIGCCIGLVRMICAAKQYLALGHESSAIAALLQFPHKNQPL